MRPVAVDPGGSCHGQHPRGEGHQTHLQGSPGNTHGALTRLSLSLPSTLTFELFANVLKRILAQGGPSSFRGL